jgi:hypothetical protein
MEFVLNYVCGFYFGPLMLIVEWLPFRTKQQNAAAELGFASLLFLVLTVWYPVLSYIYDWPTWGNLLAFTGGVILITFFIAKISRYTRLGMVSNKRKSVGFFYQLLAEHCNKFVIGKVTILISHHH